MIQPDALTIRPATEADIPALVSQSAAMAEETEGRTLDRARLEAGTRMIVTRPEHGCFWVAELATGGATHIVGQLMLTYEWSDWRNGQFWWIQSVYVAPAFRRQGVFRRLHAAVMQRAKSAGTVCGVRLYVERENRVAQSVYRRIGLRSVSYDVYEEDFVLGGHHKPAAE
ncbi:MAG: N-acetyltransferase [Nitrospiraceae bacterium]